MTNRFFRYLTLLVLVSALGVESVPAQKSSKSFEPDDRPKLVVGIVVDQMRYDYLTKYWDRFGEGGFKRLVKGGFNFANTHYNYFPTYTGPGHAAVYTGATPSVNGVVGNDWYSRELGRNMYVVEDPTVSAVGAEGEAGQMSPANLLSSTITDELKKKVPASNIVAVSVKDRGAVLPAGHLGDLSLWYDASRGHFISSSWFVDRLPEWVTIFNDSGVAERLSKQKWTPYLPLEEYTGSNADDTPYEGTFSWEERPVFPHELSRAENPYAAFISSPFGNTLVKEVALKAIEHEQLGADEHTDFLAVSFSSTDYVGHKYGPRSIEVADTYLRLDRELADLLDTLDKQVGKGNYLLFLTSDHGAVDVPRELKDRGLPGGYFDSDTAIDSLKTHLNERYGEGKWIEAYINQQVYLDRDLIEREGVALENVQREAAEYLLRFEGVLSTNTAANFMSENYNRGLQGMYRRGFLYKRSGDVYIQLGPGWLDSTYRTGTSHGSPYNYDTHVPMLLYGKGIPQGVSHRKTSITQLAPTLSTLLNVSFPDGSRAKPLLFK